MPPALAQISEYKINGSRNETKCNDGIEQSEICSARAAGLPPPVSMCFALHTSKELFGVPPGGLRPPLLRRFPSTK